VITDSKARAGAIHGLGRGATTTTTTTITTTTFHHNLKQLGPKERQSCPGL
jgi:hypothetical protein